jgi:hypothetical protein
MSGSNRRGSGTPRDARSPRARKADVIERHPQQGEPPATGTDANAAARTTRTGFPDSRMADPDAPTETRPRGQARSRLREGRTPTPGAGQGIGAGRRRRAGREDERDE